MTAIANLLGTLVDLLTVVIGFGLIVFIHELGHFIAARWARIRVLAFALGFGPALISYRKGMGFRRGSSDHDYEALVRAAQSGHGEAREEARSRLAGAVSPTEYRLNALPLGGYVKMLGQEDLNPEATSDSPDSYQNCVPWKRMVVISAGVVMNLIGAAALFVLVFSIGLKTAPPIIGGFEPGSPAALVEATNAEQAGVANAHLAPGDVVESIAGQKPRSFNDIVFATALAERGRAVELVVRREGFETPLIFSVTPEPSELADGLLQLGIGSPGTLTVANGDLEGDSLALWKDSLRRAGLDGVEPGATLVSIDGDASISSAGDVPIKFRASDGSPVDLVFEQPGGSAQSIAVQPLAELQRGYVDGLDGGKLEVEHLLGLVPLMRVQPGNDSAAQGLRPGDVFVRIGSVVFPSLADGIREIRSRTGEPIELEVIRSDEEGVRRTVLINAEVGPDGRVGFLPDDARDTAAVLARSPSGITATPSSTAAAPTPLAIAQPGAQIIEIEGVPVETFVEVRERLAALSRESAAGDLQINAVIELPVPIGAEGDPPRSTVTWRLSAQDRTELEGLAWTPPFSTGVFEPEETLLKADSPIDAVGIGLHETRRIVTMTYVQIVRLFQGSVRIEHIKGPVGIAHIGTLIADRGLVWLMFFFALISVNLAVINFLPLPIVDGGQFLMLLYEQFRGKPVPMPIQNAVTTAGLLLIASVFLIVTFNDVRSLLGL